MIQLFLYEVFGSEVSVEAATYFQKSENRFRILITGGKHYSRSGISLDRFIRKISGGIASIIFLLNIRRILRLFNLLTRRI